MARISVGLGMGPFAFDTIAGFWRWIDLCEGGGVDSFWQSDRIVSTEPFLECLSAAAAIAGRTRRLKFGMNVASLAFRDPVLLAKQCATIDVLSEGRMLPAFGIGSPTAPEWRAMTFDPKTRGAKANEAIEILQRLWTEDNVTYEGKHFRIVEASIAPKPVQAEFPLWIGGSSEGAIQRTGRYGTGWQSSGEPPDQIGPIIDRIRAAAAAAGRTIDEGHYGANLAFFFGRPDDPRLRPAIARYARLYKDRDPLTLFAVGDARTILDRLAAFATAGVSKFVLLPAISGDDAMMSQTQRLIDDVLPHLGEVAR